MMNEIAVERVTSTQTLYDRLVSAVGSVRMMAARIENVGDKIQGPGPEGAEPTGVPQPDSYAVAVANLENAVAQCDVALRRVENGL